MKFWLLSKPQRKNPLPIMTKRTDKINLRLQLPSKRKKEKFIMNSGYSTHVKNGLTCKDKWSSIFKNFHKVYDYIASTRHNKEYWAMNIIDRVSFNLPKSFR